MLSQADADTLLAMLKKIQDDREITFPPLGQALSIDVIDNDDNEKFIIDVNRRGKRMQISKATMNTRYQKSIILLRMDIGGPDHTNPDLTIVPCPHIHIYKEGYDDGWAYPLHMEINTVTSDLVQALIDFLEYNHIVNRPTIVSTGGGLFDADD